MIGWWRCAVALVGTSGVWGMTPSSMGRKAGIAHGRNSDTRENNTGGGDKNPQIPTKNSRKATK